VSIDVGEVASVSPPAEDDPVDMDETAARESVGEDDGVLERVLDAMTASLALTRSSSATRSRSSTAIACC
jgi:hypothetical protein